jgi:flagellar hook-associated protein 1 FlgK
MSLNNLVEISRRSIRTLDAALNVTGQNIANAGTPGYARRRLTFTPDAPLTRGLWSRPSAYTPLGGGVSIGSYERLRDRLLTTSAWEARGGLGYADEQQRVLGALEGAFPTDTGSLSTQLEDFWNGWSDLADNPTDTGLRLTLRSRAQTLTGSLNRLSNDVTRLQEETQTDLTQGVDTVNGLLRQIADLNVQVTNSYHQGSPDFTAEDQRDALLKELSNFVPVRVQSDADDGYTISVDGVTVVQGNTVQELTLDTSGTTPEVRFGDTPLALRPSSEGGRIGGWLHTLQTTLPETQASLDTLASTLVTQVNTLHATGYGLDGVTGRNFFDPASTTAATIQLSSDVLGDVNAIAASGDATASGDNGIALQIAALRDATLMNSGTTTMGTYVIDLVTGIGSQVESALTQLSGQAMVVDNLDGMEQGVSGVSVDEEMTHLIELQQAYAASARVLNTAQEMMDTLLNL